MRVLIACEFSGTVRDAFIAQGHEATSCDLLPTEKPGPHYQGSVLDILNDGWDLMIAHPPCTYLTVSNNGAMARGCSKYTAAEGQELRREAVEFFLALANANIPKIAIENPIGIMSSLYKKPSQIIQPYQFGHDASKKTCLWLKNLPPLIPSEYIYPRIVNGLKRWGNQTDSGQNNLPPTPDRWALRSLTYPGIAEAMANQWSRQQEQLELFNKAA